MASPDAKSSSVISPASPASPSNERSRSKSIATRVTEAEFAEVESAALIAGQKVSEWLRSAAFAQARAEVEEQTDPIVLAEIVGMRALMLDLFAKASEGPLSKEDLGKISEYADAVKQRKAEEVLTRTRSSSSGTLEK
jgi:hypothetical protein